MSKKKVKARKPTNMWLQLVRLINAHANMRVADSWSGGGDPNDVEIHAVRLKLARLELTTHIRAMRDRLEG